MQYMQEELYMGKCEVYGCCDFALYEYTGRKLCAEHCDFYAGEAMSDG